MKKKNTGKYILTTVLIIAAVAAGVFAFQFYQKNKSPVADKQFDKLQAAVNSSPLEKTDIDSLFYSEETGLFYLWDGTSFTEYPQEVRPVQVTLSGEPLNFELHLTEKDGVYFGFGRAQAAVTTYFVKAMNTNTFHVGNKSYDPADTILLLFDSTGGDMPQADRLYGDAFAYRLSDGAVIREYVQNRMRAPTETGLKRNDYFGFTTEMVQKGTETRTHFLTRAQYDISEDPYRLYDLNSTVPTYYYVGYTPDLTLQDIILNYAYDTEGGIFHFKRGDGEFYSKISTGTPEDQTICTFKGDYLKDYKRQGDYFIHTSEMLGGAQFHVTNARTGDVKAFDLEHPYQEIMGVKMNEAATRLAILGEMDWKSPKGEDLRFQLVTFVNLETGAVEQYAGAALYDTSNTDIYFSGNAVFLNCDGKLCKFDIQ